MANGRHYSRALGVVGEAPTHPCHTCGRSHPEVEFYVRKRETKDGAKRYWQSSCKDCTSANRRAKQNSVNEAGLTRSRQYYLKRRYGLTLEAWQEMWSSQGERCALCDSDTTDGKYWHVDHCHKSGSVRGILCHGCNTGLGNFRDNIDRLTAAIDYLNRTAARNG